MREDISKMLEMRILNCMRNEQGLTLDELSEMMDIEPKRLTKILADFEDKDYIEHRKFFIGINNEPSDKSDYVIEEKGLKHFYKFKTGLRVKDEIIKILRSSSNLSKDQIKEELVNKFIELKDYDIKILVDEIEQDKFIKKDITDGTIRYSINE